MIALYCRVSTLEQVNEGFSIDNQKERLEAYAKSQGWGGYRFYVDDGYTGTNMNRPALKRLIRDAQEQRINTVVVYKLDRLGRKQKDVLYLLEDIFDANKIVFKSATEPFDTETPLGKAMLGILAVFAQLERDTIVERTTSGRRQRIRRGKWYGGRVPLGYKWDAETQELNVVPDEARLIREVYTMYIQGKPNLAIAEWLNPRITGRKFSHSDINGLISRPIYTGRMNNAGVLVDGNHKRIIDDNTYERAQRELNRRKKSRTPRGDYFLSGLLECGLCGSIVYHIRSSDRKYDFYCCQAQHVRPKGSNNKCDLGYVRMEKMDKMIVDRLREYAVDPQALTEFIQSEQKDDGATDALYAKIEDIDKRLERWYDAFENGSIDPITVSERIDKLEKEKKSILIQMDEIDVAEDPRHADDFIQTMGLINESWDLLTREEQKAILRLAIEKIVIYPKGEFEFVWNT